MIKIWFDFQEAIAVPTSSSPRDFQKELYELEVSICTGLLFIITEFIWPPHVAVLP